MSKNFVVEKSQFKCYGFTIRKAKIKKNETDKLTDSELVEVYKKEIEYIKSLGIEICDYVFEETAGLHVHGVCKVPRKFNMIRLRKRGWTSRYEEIYDMAGWYHYLGKEQDRIKPELKAATPVRVDSPLSSELSPRVLSQMKVPTLKKMF